MCWYTELYLDDKFTKIKTKKMNKKNKKYRWKLNKFTREKIKIERINNTDSLWNHIQKNHILKIKFGRVLEEFDIYMDMRDYFKDKYLNPT